MAQTEAADLKGAAAGRAGSVSALGRVRLGWTVFATTSAACVAAAALDLHAGTYRALAYVGAAQGLAVTAAILTTRLPQHRMSWIIAAAGLWWGITDLLRPTRSWRWSR